MRPKVKAYWAAHAVWLRYRANCEERGDILDDLMEAKAEDLGLDRLWEDLDPEDAAEARDIGEKIGELADLEAARVSEEMIKTDEGCSASKE